LTRAAISKAQNTRQEVKKSEKCAPAIESNAEGGAKNRQKFLTS